MVSPLASPKTSRRWWWGALVLATAGLLAWKGVAIYRERRLDNFLQQGRAALARGDFRSAETWTRLALRVAPQNPEVVWLGAELEEAQDLPDAVLWWGRVVQQQPRNVGALLTWAKVALRHGQRETAERALQLVPAEARPSADYYELKAGVALAAQRPDVADACFAEAARLQPQNPVHRVNLASLRLSAKDPATVEAARQELEASLETSSPDMKLPALRALLGDAVRQQDAARMRELRARLLALPEHTWSDDLLCLSAAPGPAEFKAELGPLEVRAQADSRQVAALADWLTSHGHAEETKRWLTTLPDERRAEVRLQICLANAFTVTADWQAQREILAGGNWRQLDFLRRATILRANKELGESREKDWRDLTDDLAEQPESMLLLGQTAQAWGWTEQAEDLFWKVARQPFAPREGALQSLWNIYSAQQKTSGLLRVARQRYETTPDDPQTKNNYAFLALLLDANRPLAARLASEVAAGPNPPPQFIATHAFALHLAGQNGKALAAWQRVPETALRQPGLALYYALALAASGEREKAAEFAGLAKGGQLLPEERRLWEKLRADSAPK